MRYRYRIGRQVGRWHDSERAALLAAAKAGFGSVDEFRPAPDVEPMIYLHPLVEIETAP